MSRSSGSCVTQFSGFPSCWRSQQRVWNRQPDGGKAGEGTSPTSTIRFFRRRGWGSGTAREQRHRVRVPGRRVERVDVGDLDDLAEVHHRDAVADVLDDREVVGDEEIRQPELVLEIVEQVEDLAWIDTSSAETGSSQTRNSGLRASARAMPMRCRWPPENSCG